MFERIVRAICRSSVRRPGRWLVGTLLISVASIHEVSKVGLDTDLTRLLPRRSQAVRWSRELEAKVGGDGGYFSVILEGDDHSVLVEAVKLTAARIQLIADVQSVEFRNPVGFLDRFRYLLVPSEYLQDIFDTLVRWKDEASPFGLGLDAHARAEQVQTRAERDVEEQFRRYANLSEYHQSPDGRLMGMIVRPRKGITSLGATRDLHFRLEQAARATALEFGIWAGVSGSLRNKVDEYNQIMSDLSWSGTFAVIGIVFILVLTFRSALVLPVLIYPIGIGLLWSYALVPTLVGDLNTITSFLLMVLLGMGQEWSIHLAKRFQAELVEGGIEQALLETFLSTGRSILTSGFTTSTGMVVLAFSSFRGFAEYGVISASSMLMIFVAMFTVMPATLVMGTRMRLIRAQRPMSRALALVPPGWATGLLGAAVAAAAALTWFGLRFDYDFASLKADVPSAQEVKRRHRQVYPGFSAPAAAFVARDLPSLDSALGFLEQSRRAERDRAEALIGTISSVRTLVPAEEEALRRRTILRELQDRMQGRWVRRVKDPDKRRWIEDIRDFKPPERFPRISDLPDELHRNLVARDGSGGLILAVDIVSQKNNDGRAAMAFARELRKIDAGEALLGPTGDKLVLAEILTLVTGEGPGLVGFTFLGISVLVLLDRRGSLVDAFWILVPLVSGIILTLGVAVGLGWKLNFFNMVILPSLIGMTVDNGVHAYRRWQELGQDTRAMHTELLEPLTGSAFTTIIGYAGMTFAHHQGLRTIGSLAVLGLLCCWVTGVALMPGILRIREVWSQPSTLDRASSDTPMDSDHSEVPS